MSETKAHQFRPPLYHEEPAVLSRGSSRESSGEVGREQRGWDAYRKWLSSVNGKPQSRRTAIDHSVYSWKGYQNWADSVRDAWESEES